jgi:hypothetical protein
MTRAPRRLGNGWPVAIGLALVLAACGETPSAGVSVPIGPDAPVAMCNRLGFVSGTSALAACMAEIEGLARQHTANQSRCEGIRQRALSTRFPAGVTGNTIATADADYLSCMSGQLTPPARVELPTGRTATCRVTGMEVACN